MRADQIYSVAMSENMQPMRTAIGPVPSGDDMEGWIDYLERAHSCPPETLPDDEASAEEAAKEKTLSQSPNKPQEHTAPISPKKDRKKPVKAH